VALEGNLTDFSLRDIFKLLESGAKTGSLIVSRGDVEGVVCFRDGLVFHAALGQAEPVAKRLAGAGVITVKQLRQAQGLMKIQKKEKADRRLGQILVDEGYLEAATLEEFITGQVADVLFDLLRWEEGELRFVSGESCPEADIGVAVPIVGALNLADQRLETWHRIAEEIPSADTRFTMAAAPAEAEGDISLKPKEWALLCHLHGGRSVRELAELTGLSDYDAIVAIYEMYAGGLVEKVGAAGEPVAV
jgi:hypothetical protein